MPLSTGETGRAATERTLQKLFQSLNSTVADFTESELGQQTSNRRSPLDRISNYCLAVGGCQIETAADNNMRRTVITRLEVTGEQRNLLKDTISEWKRG